MLWSAGMHPLAARTQPPKAGMIQSNEPTGVFDRLWLHGERGGNKKAASRERFMGTSHSREELSRANP
jgi:hypothetical protein